MLSELFEGLTPRRINTEFTPEQVRLMLRDCEGYRKKREEAGEDRGADVNNFEKISQLMGL